MNKLAKYITIICFTVGFMACDDYLDINEDPNNATEAPIAGLMARTTFETGDNIQNVGGITSFYVQYLASPNEAASTDIQEPVAYDETWLELYDVMTDLSDLIIQAQELGAGNYEGVAKIVMAINLGLTVQVWGDIPYSEAFFAETLRPAYDDDQALYAEIQTLLDEGISLLSNPQEDEIPLGGEDFIYGGNTETWIKAAYALKARYGLHSMSNNVQANEILTWIQNGFSSSAENATVSYFDESINPWADVAIDNANLLLGGWISEQLVEAMDGTTFGVVDPRMPFMFGTTFAGTFVGTTNGAGRGDAAEQGERSTLVTGNYYSSRTSVLEIITYSEQKFIEAEAALLAGNSTQAYDAYLSGIAAHMNTIGVAEADISTYLSDPVVAVGSGALTQDLILKEKYVALFLNPETWVDARRYDYAYPGFTNPVNLNPELGGQLVRRLLYPESETTRNDVPTVSQLDRVWWDQ